MRGGGWLEMVEGGLGSLSWLSYCGQEEEEEEEDGESVAVVAWGCVWCRVGWVRDLLPRPVIMHLIAECACRLLGHLWPHHMHHTTTRKDAPPPTHTTTPRQGTRTRTWHLFSWPFSHHKRTREPTLSIEQSNHLLPPLKSRMPLAPPPPPPPPPPLLLPTDNAQSSTSTSVPTWERGLAVQTPYGWGTIRKYRAADAMLEVRLTEWNALAYLPPSQIHDQYVSISPSIHSNA